MFNSTIEKIKRLLTPKSARRYAVRLLNNKTGTRTPSRVLAEMYGGQWSAKHDSFLFNQECAEWYCYVRNHNNTLLADVQAYTERVI